LPLIEITVARDTLNKEQQLRMAKAVQKAMIEEFEAMKGRSTGSYVIVNWFLRDSERSRQRDMAIYNSKRIIQSESR